MDNSSDLGRAMEASAQHEKAKELKGRVENLEGVLIDLIVASARELGVDYAGQLIDRVNNS